MLTIVGGVLATTSGVLIATIDAQRNAQVFAAQSGASVALATALQAGTAPAALARAWRLIH